MPDALDRRRWLATPHTEQRVRHTPIFDLLRGLVTGRLDLRGAIARAANAAAEWFVYEHRELNNPIPDGDWILFDRRPVAPTIRLAG